MVGALYLLIIFKYCPFLHYFFSTPSDTLNDPSGYLNFFVLVFMYTFGRKLASLTRTRLNTTLNGRTLFRAHRKNISKEVRVLQ